MSFPEDKPAKPLSEPVKFFLAAVLGGVFTGFISAVIKSKR